MRILCLHGMGTSGTIFNIQTSVFRSKLEPEDFQFDFIDAPHRSPPAFGVEIFFPPPNYTFWAGIDPGSVAEAHRWLRRYFDQHGNYDAVMCFSQGCALVSSYILYHNNETPDQPLPFRGAIFICGGIPLHLFTELGIPVSDRALAINNVTGKYLQEVASSAGAEIKAMMGVGRNAKRKGLWDKTDRLHHDIQGQQNDIDLRDVYGLDMTRLPECLKISIPTVHIYGIKDPRYPASIQLMHFSVAERRQAFDHGGGHEIPRTTAVSEKIAGMVKWLQEQI